MNHNSISLGLKSFLRERKRKKKRDIH